MPNNDIAENNRSLAAIPGRGVDIPNTPSVRLQTLDLARHVATDPAGKRYVVATFDDRRLKRGFVTAVYPQQGGYLTLVRLTICEVSSATEAEAVQKHRQVVQTIQNGKLNDFVKSLQS